MYNKSQSSYIVGGKDYLPYVLTKHRPVQHIDTVLNFKFYLIELWALKVTSDFSSVQFSHSVMSDSLQPHESLQARLPCPSPTPGVHSNSRPSSRWCHPAISSSVSPFPPSPNPSQHQSLFQSVNSSHKVAKVLEFQLQHHSFWRNHRADLLQNGLVGSPCSPRDSQVFSNTTVQKHQFFGTQLSSQSNSHIHTWPLEKP